MIKRLSAVLLVLLACALTLGASGDSMNWNFDAGPANQPPAGFSFSRTGQGRQGTWAIQKDNQPPSGDYVLAQLDTDHTSYRFPVAVANEPILRDVRVSVRCKPVSG